MENEDLEADNAKHSSRLATAVSGSAIQDRETSALQSELGFTLKEAAADGHHVC